MTAADIARARLRAQRLNPPVASAPGELVRWLGAVQAQDFALSKWSIGQRAACDAKAIDAALADGSIRADARASPNVALRCSRGHRLDAGPHA